MRDIRNKKLPANLELILLMDRNVEDLSGGELLSYVIVVEHDLSVLDYSSDFICCLYGKKPDINLSRLRVVEGEFTDSQIIVMLGENGTEKSTFLRILVSNWGGEAAAEHKAEAEFDLASVSGESGHGYMEEGPIGENQEHSLQGWILTL
ncbi:hypothetical protein SASPL_110231 [Salvia splendens]|uniref:ABC transporter domain-containing protein n=1 Tax=Salvia splendens TaxID=180675 RepID=A0A8X8YA43_SALSN|nr:hypothetical protein SASPL_110231 [Salvia splendens]